MMTSRSPIIRKLLMSSRLFQSSIPRTHAESLRPLCIDIRLIPIVIAQALLTLIAMKRETAIKAWVLPLQRAIIAAAAATATSQTAEIGNNLPAVSYRSIPKKKCHFTKVAKNEEY